MVKIPPPIQETQEMRVRSLAWKDSLEKGMATHSSILAWRVHGRRSLENHHPWGYKGSDMSEATEHQCTTIILLLTKSQCLWFYLQS